MNKFPSEVGDIPIEDVPITDLVLEEKSIISDGTEGELVLPLTGKLLIPSGAINKGELIVFRKVNQDALRYESDLFFQGRPEYQVIDYQLTVSVGKNRPSQNIHLSVDVSVKMVESSESNTKLHVFYSTLSYGDNDEVTSVMQPLEIANQSQGNQIFKILPLFFDNIRDKNVFEVNLHLILENQSGAVR